MINNKYKILVSGKKAFVVDFLKHTSEYFFNLSATFDIRDIINHFKIFEPEAYVIFVEENYNETISIINKLKDHPSYNNAPIIFVGTTADCNEYIKLNPYSARLFIKRPTSADNIALRISRYFEEVKKEEVWEKKEDAIPVPEPIQAQSRKHLLVVDDDRSMLKMLKTALSDEYEVTTMVNGVLVSKFLDTKDVDLIILDHEMPIETGAEVFKKLKNHPKGRNIPVCFLTGVNERSKIEEIMRLKPHGYLQKPLDMNMLLATISNLTG